MNPTSTHHRSMSSRRATLPATGSFRVMLMMLALALLPCSLAQGQFMQQDTEPLLGWPMRENPRVQWPSAPDYFDPKLGSMWFWALNQEDSRTRFEAANAIAKAASMGMPGLAMTADRLTDMLQAEDENPLARLAAARALIALDAKEHAPLLWQANQSRRLDMVMLTDPALAKWKHPPAIEGWRRRITQTDAMRALRLSAITSLGIVEDEAAIEPLLALAQDAQAPMSLRMAAAKTLSSYASGQVNLPDSMGRRNAPLAEKLIAAHLLSIDRRPQAYEQLAVLAGDAQPAVASIAAAALLEHQPARLDPLLDTLGESDDIALRQIVIERLAQIAQPSSVESLAAFTQDPAPSLRALTRDKLIAMARQSSLLLAVHQALLQLLQGSNAFSQRQAALAAGELKLEPAADRLLELIQSSDPAVALASASALRKLALPRTQVPALAYVQDNMATSTPYEKAVVTAQLIQMLGQMGYAPAGPVLRRLVPKNSGQSVARHAAIWALGLLHADNPDDKLIADLARRANDGQGMNPEDGVIREQSVIAIARMKSPRAQAMLQRWLDDEQDTSLAPAARWGIEHVTGQAPAPLDPGVRQITGWFLEPVQ